VSCCGISPAAPPTACLLGQDPEGQLRHRARQRRGQRQAVTKGGGGEFHVGFYDALRDFRLSSNDPARAGGKKPKTRFTFPSV
jgi:hypothetical protein